MKKTVIILGVVFVVIFTVVTLVLFLTNKYNDYILPYNDIDSASKVFLDIDDVQDYKLIRHYTDTIQYHLFRKSIPVFLVDITYESNIYEEKKEYELERRNSKFEFVIDDFTGIVLSESNGKIMKSICFCDELKTVRYIVVYYKDFSDFYDDIEAFESELDVCLYGIGCKWNVAEIRNENSEESIPEKILWQKSGVENQ